MPGATDKLLINIITFFPYRLLLCRWEGGKGLQRYLSCQLILLSSGRTGMKTQIFLATKPVLFTFQNGFIPTLSSPKSSTAFFLQIPEAVVQILTLLQTALHTDTINITKLVWGIKSICHLCYLNGFSYM